MRPLIKSKSKTFNSQSAELTRALYGYRHFNKEIKRCFEKYGYKVTTSGGHIKCYFNNQLVTTIASTPSDSNAGHEIMRQIRTFWEKAERRGEY